MIKVLLDENVPNSYKKKMLVNGIKDIKRINDFGKGLPDEKVLQCAINEERTIITIDKDFHAFKDKEHCGIISLSGKSKEQDEKIVKVINQIMKDERFKQNNFRNMFIRITNQNFVIRQKIKSKYKETICKYK